MVGMIFKLADRSYGKLSDDRLDPIGWFDWILTRSC